MIKLMKNILNTFIFGVTIGSTIYLLVIAAGYQPTPPTPKNILSIMLMSGLIGLLSWIFETDSLPYFIALGVHCLSTFGLVTIMMAYNGWLFTAWERPQFWINYLSGYVIIYGLAWGIIELILITRVRRINEVLKKRNQEER